MLVLLLKKAVFKLTPYKLELLLFLVFAVLLYKINFSLDYDADFYYMKEDIYYEYIAAKQLQNKENPYNRILEGNMVENDKYATQLPLYFYSLAYLRKVSLDDFSGFIENFRNILFWFHLAGGVAIYAFFRARFQRLLGVSAAAFYVFNVWSLNSFIYLKQDMIAIALLLVSYNLFTSKRYRWISYILFGLSLGIKHIGVFVFPLFLTPIVFKEDSPRIFLRNMFLFVLTILIPTLPLFIDNPQSFINSMLFSLTREPFSSEILFGYSELLVNYNSAFDTGTLAQQMLPRLPLLIATLLCFLLLVLKKIPRATFMFLSVLVFAIFNPVIFPQYITWVIPLGLLALSDLNHPEVNSRL